MLKSLHLKNWRSIREATIEFTPITVLIGANASGKTNVLDVLYFLRDTMTHTMFQAVYSRGNKEKIRNLGAKNHEKVVIKLEYQFSNNLLILDNFEIKFVDKPSQFHAIRILGDGSKNIGRNYVGRIITSYPGAEDARLQSYMNLVEQFILEGWQLLGENFMPPLRADTSEMGDLYTIERNASNTAFILDSMKQTHPKLHESLQEDLRFLLGHVDHITSTLDEREVRVAIHENKYPDKEAPTASVGTARILAVLAAIYALDMRSLDTQNPNMPGLVVIEEPETSLNPSLLRKFVELLRGYTEDKEKPRQFILTTHNPAFLNYFEPEEVRVVSRDEDGNTVVNPIPDYIREIWLDEHGLGDAWLTNAFGGVAE